MKRSACPGFFSAIGEVLAQLRGEFPDVSVSKIRFLESRGADSQPARSPSKYRRFSPADVERPALHPEPRSATSTFRCGVIKDRLGRPPGDRPRRAAVPAAGRLEPAGKLLSTRPGIERELPDRTGRTSALVPAPQDGNTGPEALGCRPDHRPRSARYGVQAAAPARRPGGRRNARLH